MNKAAKAKLLADAVKRAEPGLAAALATVGLILTACLVAALAVYGLTAAVHYIDAL